MKDVKLVIYQTKISEEIGSLFSAMGSCNPPALNLGYYEYMFSIAYECGIRDIVIMISEFVYETRQILGDGSKFGINLFYKIIKDPVTLREAVKRISIDSTTLFIPSDTFLHPDFFRYVKKVTQSDWTDYTVFSHSDRKDVSIVLVKDLQGNHIFYHLSQNESDINRFNPQKVIKLNIPIRELNSLNSIWNWNLELMEEKWGKINSSIQKNKDDFFVGQGVRISAGAKIYPPVVIGKDSVIEDGAVIGPNVVIGEGCIVSVNTEITDSYIAPFTFLGEFTRVSEMFVIKKSLIKYDTGDRIHVPEGILIDEVNQVSEGHMNSFLEKFISAFCLLFFLPIVIVYILFNFMKKDLFQNQILKIAGKERDLTGKPEVYNLNTVFINSKIQYISKYFLFWKVIRGDIHLVGNSAFSDSVRYPTGLFTLWESENNSPPEIEESMISEEFYIKTRTNFLDFKIFLKSLFRIKQ
ncbi:MAG: hypothetical protein H7A24_09725 [Leptospiraceae bacterium]|nr:hypothetical protein [Leptospiraceae bacterium]MCP5512150.1 hypothetical protein [Leptospiraceae bacterium]